MKLSKEHADAVNKAVKDMCPELYAKYGAGNAQGLWDAIFRDNLRIRDNRPDCPCGVCEWCKARKTRAHDAELLDVLITAARSSPWQSIETLPNESMSHCVWKYRVPALSEYNFHGYIPGLTDVSAYTHYRKIVPPPEEADK